MKRYKEYKDSGVKWIGEIPGHWFCVPFRRIAKVQCNLVHPSDNLSMWQISPDSIEKDSGKIIKTRTVEEAQIDSDNHRFYKGQILYSKIRPLLNKVTIAPYDGLCSADMYPISTTENTEYIKYYMLSEAFLSSVKNIISDRVKMPKINQDELKETSIVIPPLSEQQSIVSYLDSKVSKIDEYISAAEKKIAALKELKQTLIADAVTQGINHNAPMKESGIKWIGRVPEHWEVKRLSQVAYQHFISNKNVHHQNLLSLSYGRIVRKDINGTNGLLPSSFDTYQIVEPGNIILRLTDLQNDHKSLRVGLVREEGIITSAYLCIAPRTNITPEFLYKQLHTCDIKKLFYSMGDGLRQSLNYDGMRKLSILVPPLSEQQAIVSYLDTKTAQIDRLCQSERSQIEKLKEYKQRLISDVVTGKVDVS